MGLNSLTRFTFYCKTGYTGSPDPTRQSGLPRKKGWLLYAWGYLNSLHDHDVYQSANWMDWSSRGFGMKVTQK